MDENSLWWAVNTDVWAECGEPRRLRHRPSSIPETQRVKRTAPKPTEEAGIQRVKHSAQYHQGLLLRQLLSEDRWFAAFAPEVPFRKRYKAIAEKYGLTLEQVMHALELAHRLSADGIL